MKYQERSYRKLLDIKRLQAYNVIEKETDLLVFANIKKNPEDIIRKCIIKYRNKIENYITNHPYFLNSLKPITVENDAPKIIKEMAQSAKEAEVGPMASVAGAICEFVGNDLLNESDEVIVENGGDIFLFLQDKAKVGIYAGNSPLTYKFAISCNITNKAFSICTSSATVGHSLSFGKADAVSVVSYSASCADAFATKICNMIKSENDIEQTILHFKGFEKILGISIIKNEKLGIWGDIELVSL